MKKCKIILFLILTAASAFGQRTNTFYVDQFTGFTVGEKTAKAQAACRADIPCVLVFDTILAIYQTGTMPAKCANCMWLDYRTLNTAISYDVGTALAPVTGQASTAANIFIKRFDNTDAYVRNGDNIVGGFNTWGSLMRLEGTSNPSPGSTVGAFSTLISTVNAGSDVAPNFNIAGGDTRLAGYFGARRGAGIARGITALNTLVECDDVQANVCSSVEIDINQRGTDASPTGVAYALQVASGGAKKVTAGIGVSSTNPAVNAMRYGIVVGGYDTSGMIINPSTTNASAPNLTLSGTTGSAGALLIQGWDFNAFKYTPVNDTDGALGFATKADSTTKRIVWWKRGALSFYDTTTFDGTATLNLPHGKCLGFESLAGGSTLNGFCSNSGDNGFTIGAAVASNSTVTGNTLNATAAIQANGTPGATQTVVVKGSAGANCNLVFSMGLLTSTTCP